MKGILAAAVAALVFVGAGYADDKKGEKKDEKKIDAAKLVGKWEMTKSSDENAPKGAIVEFTKDGKLTITVDLNGKKLEIGGKYKVEGDQLTVTVTPPDGGKEDSDTDTIKSMTDEKVVLVDKKGKETELTKKK
jgi:uncharacterized protein (TIGR03066 family)